MPGWPCPLPACQLTPNHSATPPAASCQRRPAVRSGGVTSLAPHGHPAVGHWPRRWPSCNPGQPLLPGPLVVTGKAMGLFKKLLGEADSPKSTGRPAWMRDGVTATDCSGTASLEVVGESHYQDALRLVLNDSGPEVHALLVPEPENPYDANAVAVWANGHKVGHLGREDAEVFQPIVQNLMDELGPIAVGGRVVGGSKDKPSLGIWLDYDPPSFGFEQRHKGTRGGHVRTGESAEDLDWSDRLPHGRLKRITALRKLLESESDRQIALHVPDVGRRTTGERRCSGRSGAWRYTGPRPCGPRTHRTCSSGWPSTRRS